VNYSQWYARGCKWNDEDEPCGLCLWKVDFGDEGYWGEGMHACPHHGPLFAKHKDALVAYVQEKGPYPDMERGLFW